MKSKKALKYIFLVLQIIFLLSVVAVAYFIYAGTVHDAGIAILATLLFLISNLLYKKFK